jgi:hypothetical protein
MQGGARLRMAVKHVPTACSDKVCVPLDKDERGTQVEEADPLLNKRRWSGDGLFKRCELWVRSLRVFWTAFRLFVDYKILQWRTNQMSEEQSEESDRLWEAVRVLACIAVYSVFRVDLLAHKRMLACRHTCRNAEYSGAPGYWKDLVAADFSRFAR